MLASILSLSPTGIFMCAFRSLQTGAKVSSWAIIRSRYASAIHPLSLVILDLLCYGGVVSESVSKECCMKGSRCRKIYNPIIKYTTIPSSTFGRSRRVLALREFSLGTKGSGLKWVLHMHGCLYLKTITHGLLPPVMPVDLHLCSQTWQGVEVKRQGWSVPPH